MQHKVYVGADHNGFKFKEDIVKYLSGAGYDVEDLGSDVLDAGDDFPVIAAKVATSVAHDGSARGIVLCGSGQGVCIAANRFKGIRAGLGYDRESVRSARNDDDINVLCLPAHTLERHQIQHLVDTFLSTQFDGAQRFRRRISQLDNLPH